MRKFCCFLSILFLSVFAIFGCSSEEYHFYLLENNYNIYVNENINIENLNIKTNIPNFIDNYELNYNSDKIEIKDNLILALKEGSVEVTISIKYNNKTYSDVFTLNINPILRNGLKIEGNYLIDNVCEDINCLSIILKDFTEIEDIFKTNIFKRTGFISYKRVGLKLNIYYYKNSKCEKVINWFVTNNFINIDNFKYKK